MPNALILSASVGGGHVSAAEAIAAECRAAGVDARHCDLMEFTSRGFRAWYRGGYETLVRRFRGGWGHLYRASDRPLAAFWLQTALDATFARSAARLAHEFRPDWIIATHSLPLPVLATPRRKLGFRTAVVVTDLHPHLMWLRGVVDRYFVPTDATRDRLLLRNARFADATRVTGIPIHRAFDAPKPVGGSQRRVLISAGGIGGGPLEDVARVVSTLPLDVQASIFCGRNQVAFDRLTRMRLAGVEVVGQIPNSDMASRMLGADLLISKCGGATMFEGLAAGLPTVVYSPMLIPGQEEDNARYLVANGAGIVVDDATQLRNVVCDLLMRPEVLGGMSFASRSLARPRAAREIVADLFGVSSGAQPKNDEPPAIETGGVWRLRSPIVGA